MKNEDRVNYALGFLPERIKEKIIKLALSRKDGITSISEIRLRSFGRASVTFNTERVYIGLSATENELAETVKRLTFSALYAHREDIASGFISAGYGLRVGAVGTASYDGGRPVGISQISSLLFRIPSGECSFGEELVGIYRDSVKSGMIIYSPPGGGKTTALRSLALSLGSGQQALSVAVIDERREFFKEDYISADVDILSGYKKSAGIEIATRTMSPDVIMIDEIGANEAEAIAAAVSSGVPIVASAHASSLTELLSKASLSPLFAVRAFDTCVGILPDRRLKVDKYD